MDFEIINESPDSTSLSSPSSLSPCTPPNSNPLSDSPNPQPSNIYTNPSHKRKAGRKKFGGFSCSCVCATGKSCRREREKRESRVNG